MVGLDSVMVVEDEGMVVAFVVVVVVVGEGSFFLLDRELVVCGESVISSELSNSGGWYCLDSQFNKLLIPLSGSIQ